MSHFLQVVSHFLQTMSQKLLLQGLFDRRNWDMPCEKWDMPRRKWDMHAGAGRAAAGRAAAGRQTGDTAGRHRPETNEDPGVEPGVFV